MNIAVTESAFNRIKQLVCQSNKFLRVSVDGGGCSGLLYKYELSDKLADDDLIIESKGIKVAIDSISQPYLLNCTVDYIEELGNSYFEVKNPKAKDLCGCGNSFSI